MESPIDCSLRLADNTEGLVVSFGDHSGTAAHQWTGALEWPNFCHNVLDTGIQLGRIAFPGPLFEALVKTLERKWAPGDLLRLRLTCPKDRRGLPWEALAFDKDRQERLVWIPRFCSGGRRASAWFASPRRIRPGFFGGRAL